MICNEFAKYQPASLRKQTLLHILLHVFCFHFLRMHHDYFFRKGFENVQTQFLSRNIRKAVLLVIYLFNYDSSKSTFFMLNMAFDVLSSTVFVKKKLEFFVSCKIKITRTSFFLLWVLIYTF